MGHLTEATIAALRPTLLSGSYTLLIGAGVHTGAKTSFGADLETSSSLRERLIKLKNLRPSSSLSRAYSQLGAEEVREHITPHFQGIKAGPAVRLLTQFYWRRVYTFNIDDAIEGAYSHSDSLQKIESLTQRSIYKNIGEITNLQVVHVHGWTGRVDDGYIFSPSEYASTMGPGSSWIQVLSQTMAVEPFIIAGCGLEEPDLEYFLQGRSQDSVRSDRGLSFLIEPYPDAGTLKDCERHGLTLYPGTLEEFLSEIDEGIPSRTVPLGATRKLDNSILDNALLAKDLALFERHFEYIIPQQAIENVDLGFYVGRDPRLEDIALSRDVSRLSSSPLKSTIRQWVKSPGDKQFLVGQDAAGTGKSTLLHRVLYDLSGEGIKIFRLRDANYFDIEIAKNVFQRVKGPFVVYVDDFADNSAAIMRIYNEVVRPDLLFLCVERDYRDTRVKTALGGVPFETFKFEQFTKEEANALISKMDEHGLTSEEFNRNKMAEYAAEVVKDPISLAVCRVLNDFRPVERIIESLIDDANSEQYETYLACALSAYCYRSGLPYNILATSFVRKDIKSYFYSSSILPLSFSDEGRDYVTPLNPLLSRRFLFEASVKDHETVFDVYCKIGSAISPYVNRATIRSRSPEARLGARLFDYDDVAKPILGSRTEAFYVKMKSRWDWNSRYWEQLALLKLDQFHSSDSENKNQLLAQAVQHAKHALKRERHAFGLTTLGKVLLEDARYTPSRAQKSFEDAFDSLVSAAKLEGYQNRIAIHPYAVLFPAMEAYFLSGGKLGSDRKRTARELIGNFERIFAHESKLMINIINIRPHIE